MGELIGQGTHGKVLKEQGTLFYSADAVTAWSTHTHSQQILSLLTWSIFGPYPTL